MQFSLDFQGNFGKLLKDYGDLKLGNITSSCSFGDFAVFGGDNGKLAFINVKNREYLGNTFELAPKKIHSIEICWVKQKHSQSKALLAVSGYYYDYFFKTDLLDITNIISNAITIKIDQKLNQIQKTF